MRVRCKQGTVRRLLIQQRLHSLCSKIFTQSKQRQAHVHVHAQPTTEELDSKDEHMMGRTER
jgi:hypothetical protein